MTNSPAASEPTPLPLRRTEDELAATIAAFKAALIEQGYQRANEADELVSKDRTTWVSTTFTHGECRIYMFRRPLGYGNPEGRCFVVFGLHSSQDLLTDLAVWLSHWVKHPPKANKYQWPAPASLPAYP